MAGIAVSYCFTYDIADGYDWFHRVSALTGSVLTAVIPLVFFFRGDAHELDPIVYANKNDQLERGVRAGLSQFGTAFIAETISLGIAYVATRTIPPDCLKHSIKLYFGLLMLSLSLSLFDEFLKGILFFDSDFDEDMDITVNCLLSNPSIAQKALSKEMMETRNEPTELLEVKLVESLSDEMAKSFLKKVDDRIEAPLEEDILRFNVLRTLVQGHTIQKNLDIQRDTPGLQGEPSILCLVRGLCIFAGGIGESFRRSTEKQKFSKIDEKWRIPPGAIVEVILAIKAIAKCLQLVQKRSTKSISIQLSVVIPAVVLTLFHVRTSTCKVAGIKESNSPMEQTSPLYRIVEECDKAAATIVSTQSGSPQQIYRMPLARIISEWLQCASNSQ